MSDTSNYPDGANLVEVEVNTMSIKGLKTVEPADIQTYDLLAGEEGAALKSANANARYRSQFAQFRTAFIDRVREETGIEFVTREVEEVDEETGEKTITHVRNEKDTVYFGRVLDERDEDPEDWKGIAQEVLDGIPFDPSATERGPAKPRVRKTDIKMVKLAFKRGDDVAQALCAKLSEALGEEVPLEVEPMAVALQRYQQKMQDELFAG
jgi:hypothetical protein